MATGGMLTPKVPGEQACVLIYHKPHPHTPRTHTHTYLQGGTHCTETHPCHSTELVPKGRNVLSALEIANRAWHTIGAQCKGDELSEGSTEHVTVRSALGLKGLLVCSSRSCDLAHQAKWLSWTLIQEGWL